MKPSAKQMPIFLLLVCVASLVWACFTVVKAPDPTPTQQSSSDNQPPTRRQPARTSAPDLAMDWPDLSVMPAQGGGQNDAALIIGIENYAFAPPVKGAVQNARDWYQYFVKTRQIPISHVKLLLDDDASLEMMEEAAEAAAAKVKEGGTLWVIFIGHGAPSEADGVLIGVDAQQKAKSLYARSLPQRRLIELTKGQQAQTLLVLDACFSGKVNADTMFAEGLQPLLLVDVPQSVTVLSAGATNEFAGPLPSVERPAFSYLVLGAMRGWGDSDGDKQITAEEAVNYAREVLQTVVQDRKQTPQVSGPYAGFVLSKIEAVEDGPDLAAMVFKKSPSGAPVSRAAEDMVEVPAGEFWMGCHRSVDSGCDKDEEPGRNIKLAAFQIDKTEVTVDAYKQCVNAGQCSAPSTTSTFCSGNYTQRNNWSNPGRGNHPVNCVSWDQANTYCIWAGKTLPTEAQWEKAARGTDGQKYPWGNTEPASAGKVGNFADATAKRTFSDWPVIEGYDDGFDMTAPVGSFPPGVYGVYDMGGNVWEWTADEYRGGYDDTSPAASGSARVVRGGSFGDNNALRLRASDRNSNLTDTASVNLGLRCVVSF